MVEDRSLLVQPNQVVRAEWISIDLCVLGCRVRMNPEAVEKKFRKLLQQGDAASWPPIVGHWEGERFSVDDGRHEFLASLMLGRTRVFVCWMEVQPKSSEFLTLGNIFGQGASVWLDSETNKIKVRKDGEADWCDVDASIIVSVPTATSEQGDGND